MKLQEFFASTPARGASAVFSLACVIYIAWAGFEFGHWLAK
jgi:hypothetical protein